MKTTLKLTFHESSSKQLQKKNLYVRSAHRNDPNINGKEIHQLVDLLDDYRINRMIDNDVAVAKNYRRMVSYAIEEFLDLIDGPISSTNLKETVVDITRSTFLKVCPDLELQNLGRLLGKGTFQFTKGSSEDIPFKNLSSGEMAVFDLILDLIIAQRVYNDTLYCIDEPESHLNPKTSSATPVRNV